MRTLLMLAVLALGAGAQYYPANYLISGSAVQVIDGAGNVTTLIDNQGTAYAVTMDWDNTNVLYGDTTGDGFFRIDPATNAVTTILIDPNLFNTPTQIEVNQDGDYIIAGDGTAGYGLYKLSGSTLSTIMTTLTSSLPGTFTGGMVIDVDTGEYVAQLYGGTTGPHPLVSIHPTTGAITTIAATISTLGAPRFSFCQDPATSDFWVGVNDSTSGYLYNVSRAGLSTLVATSTDRFAFNVLEADRAGAASPRLVHNYISNLYYTDLTTFQTTSIAINGSARSPRGTSILNRRELQTVRVGTRKWDLLFSFPNNPSTGYVAAITLSGVRPGLPLADGRRILLNLDALTIPSIQGLLAPLFNPGPLTLDANGTARGSLDLSAIPTLGFTLHINAIVLDPSAPLGVAIVADPIPLRI